MAWLREKAAGKCRRLWVDGMTMKGENSEFLPLPKVVFPTDNAEDYPENVTPEILRKKLKESQQQDKELSPIMQQLAAQEDPQAYKKRKTGLPKVKGPLRPLVADTMRLASDGVLESLVLLHQGEAWVPYLPAQPMPYTVPEVTWRRWLFDQVLASFTQNHRTFMETFSLLRRSAHWPYLARDSAEWHRQCSVCAQYRGATMRPPMKSIYAQEAHVETFPWEDVIIDVQGPFSKSEDGMLYLLSYHCSRLRFALGNRFDPCRQGTSVVRSLLWFINPVFCLAQCGQIKVRK